MCGRGGGLPVRTPHTCTQWPVRHQKQPIQSFLVQRMGFVANVKSDQKAVKKITIALTLLLHTP